MALNYYKAYKDNIAVTPSQSYKDDLQYMIDLQFENSSSLYTIKEENPTKSNVWIDVDVRINHVLSTDTSVKLGDDFRQLVFANMDHPKGMGYKYKFDDYTWLTINTDNYKFVTSSAVIRRCNHTLKWYNKEGKLIEEPCIIDYYDFRSILKENQNMILPDNKRNIFMQLNDNTKEISLNKRFIFNNMAWQVTNFDMTGYPNIVFLTVVQHELDKARDDENNEIANAYELPVYEISILNNDIELQAGNSIQLKTQITKDGDIVNVPVLYMSSDETIATVSTSGLVTAVSNGVCNISVKLENNGNVSDVINATIKDSPVENTIEDIVGDDNISVGVTTSYQIYKYINGVAQPDTFTFSINNSLVKLSSITGNTVKVKAGKATGVVILTATNNTTNAIITKTIDIVTLW